MVRLMLVLAPIMCILSGVAVSHILRTFLPNVDTVPEGVAVGSESGQKRPAPQMGAATAASRHARVDSTYPFKSQVSFFNFPRARLLGIDHPWRTSHNVTMVFGEGPQSPSIRASNQPVTHVGRRPGTGVPR